MKNKIFKKLHSRLKVSSGEDNKEINDLIVSSKLYYR